MSDDLFVRRKPQDPDPQSAPLDGAPDAGTSMAQAETEPVYPFDNEELLQRCVNDFKQSRDHWQEFKQEASDCYDFVSGHQWDDEDLEILEDQSRPAMTFNRIGPFVDGVAGLEIGNRQTTQYLPRTLGDSGVDDLLTAAAQWVRDECDAEDEESEAFRDLVICGMACTQTLMAYDDDPDGMIQIVRVDPLEMFPDPTARKQNLDDARFVIRCKDIPLTAARAMYPNVNPTDLHAMWAEDQPDEAEQPHNARLAPYYRIDQGGQIDRQRPMVRMVEYEWWEYERAYRVLDPQTLRWVRLEPMRAEVYKLLAERSGRPVQMMPDRRKVYWKAIVGNIVLQVTKGADDGGFTYKFMTGKRDRNRGTWYGLVRAMRDPQMWANKWMSQALHIVNTNAKGGLLAETDAFADINEARNDWASADSIIELNQGGMGKVQQKNPPAFPTQINQMIQFAVDAIPATSGVNLEMIAMQNREQAGVLEMQRKQQGMTVLAVLFNAKRRYMKEQGRLMLWMIQTFIADGRLIRIGGPENAKYVELVHTPGLAEYDVIVDDAPTSPNMKERVWAGLMQVFPMLSRLPLPMPAWLELMSYAPFPTSLVEKLREIMQTPPPPRQPSPLEQARVDKEQAAARHYDTKSLVAAASVSSDSEARAADIENKKANAIAALAKVGLAQDSQTLAEAEAAVRTLLDSSDQGHRHAMEHLEIMNGANDAAPGPEGQPGAGAAAPI